jgi:hypothetical protein
MKIAFYVVAAIVLAGIAYSLGPDTARYLKIRSM